jgi:Tol biopolymer transport system component
MDSMNRDRSVEDRISLWLESEAPDQLPDRVLRATFELTRRRRQHRMLPAWRPFARLRLTRELAAFGTAAIVLLLAGAALLPRWDARFGGAPTPSPSPTPTATASPTLEPVSLSGEIAFERTVDGNTDIYLMNLDRTGLVRLTDDPAPDRDPGWSPRGEHLVFTRDVAGVSQLFVTPDGKSEVPLTTSAEGGTDGRFSPDGGSIAYWRGGEGSAQLRLIDADGSNDRLVRQFTDPFTGGVAWTADGRAILFGRDLSTSGGGIDIIKLDIASKALTAITTEPGDDSTFAVSPDGTTIAFQSDRLQGGIFLMDVDGSNVRHVIGTWTKGTPVSWSPDGQHLVVAQPDGWLYLVRTDGTELIKWTQGGPGVAWRPLP